MALPPIRVGFWATYGVTPILREACPKPEPQLPQPGHPAITDSMLFAGRISLSKRFGKDKTSAFAAGGLLDQVRPQSNGHLPFVREPTASDSFHILRTGATDPYA